LMDWWIDGLIDSDSDSKAVALLLLVESNITLIFFRTCFRYSSIIE
jgi:hypothetical protein